MKRVPTVVRPVLFCLSSSWVMLMMTAGTWAQVKFSEGEATTPAEIRKMAEAQTANGTNQFAVPDSKDPTVLAKFLADTLEFQGTTPDELKAYQEAAPLAMTMAAQKILELEADENSDNFLLAKKYLLAVDVMSIQDATAAEKKQLMQLITENLAHSKMDADDVDIAVAFAEGLEFSGDIANARMAYATFAKALAKHKDPLLAELAQLMEGSSRRLGLIGSAIDVSGTMLNGQPFAWNKMRGKVVLVDFWATWCGPCKAEFPQLKKLYDSYKSRGFEVIAICLDEDRAQLNEFLKKESLPWITLHDQGGVSPTADRYGVTTLPTSILVDKNGRVVSLAARGDELTKQLEKLLGNGRR